MEFWVISAFSTFSSDTGVKSKKKLPNFENAMSQNLMGGWKEIDARFCSFRGPPNGILGHFHFLNFFLRCMG
jgi:hypothetical protein